MSAPPEWLTKYEERAKAAGYKASVNDPTFTVEPWLLVSAGDEVRAAIFGPGDFILTAQLQNRPPADLLNFASLAIVMIERVMGDDLHKPKTEIDASPLPEPNGQFDGRRLLGERLRLHVTVRRALRDAGLIPDGKKRGER